MNNFNDLKKTRKFAIRGERYFEFVYFNSWQLFQYIANIIESNISVKIIEKIDGDWFRLNKYKKKGIVFQLQYDRDFGTCLKLPDTRDDDSQDDAYYKFLEELTKKIAKYIAPPPDKEYRINEHITLKLWNKHTFIFVDNVLFNQCLGLYLIIPNHGENHNDIKSIDEANEKFNIRQFGIKPEEIKLKPEEEFWGHCSNIQAWVENNYDTRIIHHNLAFPLLKKLTEAGDIIAKKVFKEEIAKCYKSGFASVVKFLKKEGYLKYFSREEINSLK